MLKNQNKNVIEKPYEIEVPKSNCYIGGAAIHMTCHFEIHPTI